MNNQQAVKILKEEKSWESDDRKIDAFIMAIEALEKQTPIKYKLSGVTDRNGVFHIHNGIDGRPYELCPNCETNLCTDGMSISNKPKCCKECGQRLSWSDDNDD